MLDIDGIRRALTQGAGSVVLCNPWNPTGRVLTEEEVGEVVEVAASHSARVIADEVHAPLVRSASRHVVAARAMSQRCTPTPPAPDARDVGR